MTCERSHEGWDVCWNIVNDDAHIREVETMIEQISTPRPSLNLTPWCGSQVVVIVIRVDGGWVRRVREVV